MNQDNDDTVTVEIIKPQPSRERNYVSICIDGTRITTHKTWGIGTVVKRFEVKRSSILAAIGYEEWVE